MDFHSLIDTVSVDEVISVIFAVVLGAIIGIEREFKQKAAGLRTNVLICVGAAVFTMISKNMGIADGHSTTRIAAQVVTGVGFLGAGAIIRDRAGVFGLTTAATIWLVASIGMACGAGYYSLALITTVIVIVVLIGLGQIERIINRNRDQKTNESFQ